MRKPWLGATLPGRAASRPPATRSPAYATSRPASDGANAWRRPLPTCAAPISLAGGPASAALPSEDVPCGLKLHLQFRPAPLERSSATMLDSATCRAMLDPVGRSDRALLRSNPSAQPASAQGRGPPFVQEAFPLVSLFGLWSEKPRGLGRSPNALPPRDGGARRPRTNEPRGPVPRATRREPGHACNCQGAGPEGYSSLLAGLRDFSATWRWRLASAWTFAEPSMALTAMS